MPTANQTKMAKVRAAKGKAKKPKKGGCSKCPKNRNMNMVGEGAKIDAALAFATKAAAVAAKAAAVVLANKEKILAGLKAGTDIAGVAGSITGNKGLTKVGSLRGLLGKGRDRGRMHGRGPGNLINTGMQAAPMLSYPNSSALFTGSLVF